MVREFILNSGLGQVKLEYDPIGWDDIDKTLTRSPEYLGVFRSYTADLEFVKDGLQYIANVFETLGTEAEVQVTIYRKKDFKDEKEIEFQGIAILNPYQIEYKGTEPYVKIKFEDSGFHNRFITRDDQKVNLGNTTSIEGVELGALSQKQIILHQRQILKEASFELDSANVEIDSSSISGSLYGGGGHNIPVNIVSDEVDQSQTPYSLEFLDAGGCFINQTENEQTINIYADGSFQMSNFVLGGGNVPVQIVILTYPDDTFTSPTITVLHNDTLIFQEVTTVTWNAFTIITLNPGESLSYSIYLPTPTGYSTLYSSANLRLESIDFFDSTQVKCTMRHEALERNIQIITDKEDSFKSDVFGRQDIGYDQDGTYSNNVVLSGKEARGFSDFPEMSIKDQFKSIKSIFNVGLGIEKINRVNKVVIEELPYFFSGEVGLTVHNATAIKKTVYTKGTFSDVKVGYPKADLEIVNGLEEYNNRSDFATFIKSQKGTLDLISTEYSSGYLIEKLRRKNLTLAATEDLKEDNNIITIQVDLDTSPLQAEKDENFESVENIFSPNTSYNLEITPKRNLLRSSDWLNAGLLKYQDETLKFTNADLVSDLITKKIGEDEVQEQTDLLNSDLLDPLWVNEIYSIDGVLTPSDFDILENNTRKLVKFSQYSRDNTYRYYYGWILEAKGGGEGRKGTMKLLRANLNSKRVRLIDPEGIAPAPPGSVQPPQEEGDGFELIFETVFIS